MKFMKLGSKPDAFRSDGNGSRSDFLLRLLLFVFLGFCFPFFCAVWMDGILRRSRSVELFPWNFFSLNCFVVLRNILF